METIYCDAYRIIIIISDGKKSCFFSCWFCKAGALTHTRAVYSLLAGFLCVHVSVCVCVGESVRMWVCACVLAS